MSQIKNDRLLRAIWREPLDRTPMWLMRQAGRYLPEYQATRAIAGSFMNLCKTPDLAAEVTLQPLKRYPLDAAIIFSDILTIPDAMGLGLAFIEGKGPVFAHPINTVQQIDKLTVPDLGKLAYVYEAIQLTKQGLNNEVPLIGFCGSPWTLAAYMIEGKSVPQFPSALAMLNTAPEALHKLLSTLAISITQHLNQQIIAGADVVMLFDTWGGILSTQAYEKFSLFYLKQILDGIKRHYNNRKIPVILFTKGGNRWLEQIANTGCDVVGVDWEISLQEVRKRIGCQVAIQGNLNPAFLLETPEMIRKYASQVIDSFGAGSGHIFNLGHGITPNVPPENVNILIETVHRVSKAYHA